MLGEQPNNIMICPGTLEPKMIDVGIARSFAKPALGTSARGMPSYMCPEQLDAQSHVKGPEWDVYSFAVVVNEMVVEKQPWWDDDKDMPLANKIGWQAFTEKVQAGDRPKPRVEQSKALGKLIDRCWSRSKEKRPAMEKVASELEQMLVTADLQFAKVN